MLTVMKVRRLVFGAALAAALTAAGGPVVAQSGRTPRRQPTTTRSTRAAFQEASSTWGDIQAQMRDLAQMIKDKRLDEVHPVAFEVRDLVRTLPEKSRALPPAILKKLEAQVRIMDRLAEQLDGYADAGKQRETARQEQAVIRTLETIRTLYPMGALAIHPSAPPATSKEKELYLSPGGAYTDADIKANGNDLPSKKFRGIKVSHDLKPKVGDRICPITLTKANPGYSWVIAGQSYQFCCPPCLEEYLTQAKKDPTSLKPADSFVKQ